MEKVSETLRRLTLQPDSLPTQGGPTYPPDCTWRSWEHYRAEVAGRPTPNICPVCKGIGWLAPHETCHMDELKRCPTCGQGQQKAWMAAHCGLEPHEQRRKLHHWRTPELPIKQQAQRQKARTMILDALESKAGLYTFYGDYGSGKTLALQIVVNEMRDSCTREGFYAPFIRILHLMRSCYDKTEGASQLWQRILDVPVLAVDEVTRLRDDSQWQQEMLFDLADTRYRRIESHLTVFATNDDPTKRLPPSESIGYLYSRMREGKKLCELRGDVREAV